MQLDLIPSKHKKSDPFRGLQTAYPVLYIYDAHINLTFTPNPPENGRNPLIQVE
jgi:hypothetical protein